MARQFRVYVHHTSDDASDTIRLDGQMYVGTAIEVAAQKLLKKLNENRSFAPQTYYFSMSTKADVDRAMSPSKLLCESVESGSDVFLHIDAELQQCWAAFARGRARTAIAALLQVVSRRTNLVPRLNASALLGLVLEQCRRPVQAVSLLQDSHKGRPWATIALLNLRKRPEVDSTLEYLERDRDWLPEPLRRQMDLLRAHLEASATALERVMQYEGDPNAYMMIARQQADVGQHQVSVGLAMKAIMAVQQPKPRAYAKLPLLQMTEARMYLNVDQTLRYCVHRAMKESGKGVVHVLKMALDDTKSPVVYSYLADCLKDAGDVDSAIALKKLALSLCGSKHSHVSVGLCLSLVHSLEALMRFDEAFDEAKAFLQCCDGVRVEGLDLSRFLAILRAIGRVTDDRLKTGTHPTAPAYTVTPELPEQLKCQVFVPGANTDDITQVKMESNSTLDLLALMFAVVKIAFVAGAVQVIPALIQVLEKARGNYPNLHFTTIRNEHAYYTVVAQLVRDLPFPLQASLPRLYMVGDSHCLSSAWRVVSVDGIQRLVQPQLVTGMKVWHTRRNSFFYTKKNFDAAVEPLTAFDTAIFNFGEIDCREGMLLAVQKGRYDSLEEAIQHTVSIYVETLQRFVADKMPTGYVFVHSVNPVLQMTRNTVACFNQVLQQQLRPFNDSLKFIALSDQLLDKFDEIHKDFRLDGTHLHGRYVRVLQEQLTKALVL